MKIKILTIAFFLLSSLNLYAQRDECKEGNLKKSLFYLADDKMRGREAGTKDDLKAAEYISDILESYGYSPVFGNNTLFPYKLIMDRVTGEGSVLTVGERRFYLGTDFFVPPFSVASMVTGEISLSPEKGKVLILNTSSDSIRLKIASLRDNGVAAILFWSGPVLDTASHMNTPATSIPVMQITEECAGILSSREGETVELITDVAIGEGTSYNVVMSLISGWDKPYIMIGAHYDHIGMGGDGSRTKGRSQVHNGADDNASGVSSILEIARLLAPYKKQIKYNIIIAALGAEEKGLIGSTYLADTLKKMGKLPSLMVNLDMVGRLTDDRLQAGGVGTFSQADSILRESNKQFNFNLSITQDGYGSSDHASFSAVGVPVLYFTTGVHSDYHTPYDDPDKINFFGLKLVTEYISTIASRIAISGIEMKYIRMTPPPTMSRAAFKVTLGLIPDFTYEVGDGFKVGPVTEGKPAHKAGMNAGDIITAINSKKINNIYEYMSRLSELKAGERVVVDIRRNGNELKLVIQL